MGLALDRATDMRRVATRMILRTAALLDYFTCSKIEDSSIKTKGMDFVWPSTEHVRVASRKRMPAGWILRPLEVFQLL